jgi:predicted permease
MAIDAFILILSMLSIGYLFARLRVLPENTPDVLNRVVIYLCLPAAVLLHVPRMHMELRLAGLMLTPWLMGLVSWGILAFLRKRLGFRPDEYAVLLLCVILGNTAFIGYPMTRALLGEEAVAYAVIYDQFGAFLMLSSCGLYLCAKYSGGVSPPAGVVIRRILSFPPAWALLAGLTFMPQNPPGWLQHGLQNLSDAMLPLVMLAVGFSLRFQLPRHEIRALSLGLALKLLLLPALAWGLSLLMGLSGNMLRVNVLETAMPPMITAAALAIAHRLAPRLAAALAGYGILFSLITLPFWAWALRFGNA